MLEFKLPEVGENITSGTIVGIAVKTGDTIKKNQDLLELETDKASLPVPSPCDGVIKEILIEEGQEVQIGQIIMHIESGASSSEPETKKEPAASKKTTAEKPKAKEAPTPTPAAQQPAPTPVAVKSPPKSGIGDKAVAAPSVRRLARELGINLDQITGTGPSGRISKDDVKAFTKQVITSSSTSSGGASVTTPPLPDFTKFGEVNREKMNNIRKKTATHLSACWNMIPHVTQFDKADITELDKLRKKVSTKERKLTITPFLMKVMAAALKEFPQFNTSIDMATNEIIYKKYFNIGVAVDTDRGLLVPVLRDIEKKSIFELADELNAIAQKARDKKISLDDLQGGSITLTNLGGIGGTSFTPIVNWPEVSILGVSRGSWEPVYQENKFLTRFKLPLSLSYDHRIIDGADGARFLRWIADAIEQPFLMDLNG